MACVIMFVTIKLILKVKRGLTALKTLVKCKRRSKKWRKRTIGSATHLGECNKDTQSTINWHTKPMMVKGKIT